MIYDEMKCNLQFSTSLLPFRIPWLLLTSCFCRFQSFFWIIFNMISDFSRFLEIFLHISLRRLLNSDFCMVDMFHIYQFSTYTWFYRFLFWKIAFHLNHPISCWKDLLLIFKNNFCFAFSFFYQIFNGFFIYGFCQTPLRLADPTQL